MIYLYLNHLEDFKYINENIIKFSSSYSLDEEKFKIYSNYNESYVTYKVETNDNIIEQNILNIFNIFNQLFIQESDYGKEYFNGDFKLMVQIIELHLINNKYNFEIVDLTKNNYNFEIVDLTKNNYNYEIVNLYKYLMDI